MTGIFLLIFVAVDCAAQDAKPDAWRLSVNRPAERDALWREDLRYLAEKLPKKHKDAFHSAKREDWEKRVAQIDAEIPKLQDHEVVIALARLVALLGDGHTALWPPDMRAGRTYPLTLYWFSDGVFVVATTAEHRELLGARLLRIGSVETEKAFERIATVFPHENPAKLKLSAPQFAISPQALHSLRLAESAEKAAFTFRTRAGEEKTVEFALLDPAKRPAFVRHFDDPKQCPLGFRNTRTAYWFEYVPDQKLLFVQYNRCENAADKPFVKFAAEVMERANQGDVEKMVIDLRHNGGGNSAIMWPLTASLRGCDKLNQKGRLFVLIGRATFSSAQLNANELRTQTNAVLFGEPTGQKPNAFGEIKPLKLPNSGLELTYSTKYFLTDPQDPPSMMPDVPVELSSADYFANRDPVLEAVIGYHP